jgi:GT2 family glycosyltransferase
MGTGWLEILIEAFSQSHPGVLGPRIVTNDGANEGCGIIVASAQTPRGFDFQILSGARGRLECDALPSDCLVTSRAVFDELGGFADAFGSELEGIDYCLRVAESGRRVVLESAASFTRLAPGALPNEDQSAHEAAFTERWRGRAEPHENFWPEYTESILRTEHFRGGLRVERVPIPRVAVLLHGAQPSPAFVAQLTGSRMKPASAMWADAEAAVRTARDLTELRGPDYVAFVRTDTEFAGDWLNELVNAIERAPDTAAAIVAEPADARCTLVAPRRFPQHLRIEDRGSFDAAVAGWLHAVRDMGRAISHVRRSSTVVGSVRPDVLPQTTSVSEPVEPFASIVMLSWNAPEYTELAIESIRARTSIKHEIIVVDNASGPETISRLKAIPEIRVIYNAVNTGFAFASNQGIAAAAGTHIVLLNNDVVVSDGWLEALVDVQQAHPTVGCSAPRSNEIAGQQRLEVPYRDVADMPAFAARRAVEQRGRWTRQSRVIGVCMCLARPVIEEIGGLDPRYGTGNFEDDDYCMRIRSAGYDIVVCEDSFVHHFGSVSFRANDVDYNATFERNRKLFERRWNVTFTPAGYDGWLPSQRGFVRERDFVALPPPVGVESNWTALGR